MSQTHYTPPLHGRVAGTILRDYTADTLASLTDYGYTQLLGMHS